MHPFSVRLLLVKSYEHPDWFSINVFLALWKLTHCHEIAPFVDYLKVWVWYHYIYIFHYSNIPIRNAIFPIYFGIIYFQFGCGIPYIQISLFFVLFPSLKFRKLRAFSMRFRDFHLSPDMKNYNPPKKMKPSCLVG